MLRIHASRGQVLCLTQLTGGVPSVGAYDLTSLQPVDTGTLLALGVLGLSLFRRRTR